MVILTEKIEGNNIKLNISEITGLNIITATVKSCDCKIRIVLVGRKLYALNYFTLISLAGSSGMKGSSIKPLSIIGTQLLK